MVGIKGLGIVVLMVFLVGCNGNYDNGVFENYTQVNKSVISYEPLNDTEQERINKLAQEQEDFEHRCWEDMTLFCQRECSRRTGFIYSDLMTYNPYQFDLDGDGNFSEKEIAEWDYREHLNSNCMEDCIVEEVYPCFR